MKAFIATYSYDYEDGEVIGVYSTIELAAEALKKHIPFNAASIDIIEIELDEYIGIYV